MKTLNSIKTKISIFLILFAIILIFGLLAYVYWNGRQNIIDQSEQALNIYSKLLYDDYKTQIENSIYELNGLIFQLDHLNVYDYPEAESAKESITVAENFVTGYAPKYSQILIINSSWQKYIELSPVVVYGGQRKSQKLVKPVHNLSERLKGILNNIPEQSQILNPDFSKSGEHVFLILPLNHFQVITKTRPYCNIGSMFKFFVFFC